MDYCPLCGYPDEDCDCDPTQVDGVRRNALERESARRDQETSERLREHYTQQVRDIMQYQYVQVMNNDKRDS